jgi:hypothetical protein
LFSRRVDALTEAFIRKRSKLLGWNTRAECVTKQKVHFDRPIPTADALRTDEPSVLVDLRGERGHAPGAIPIWPVRISYTS